MEKVVRALQLHHRCSRVIVGILVAPLSAQRTTSPGLTIQRSNMLAFLGLRLYLRWKRTARLFSTCFKAWLAYPPVWFSSAQHGRNGRYGRRYLCRVSYYCDSLRREVFSSVFSYLFVSIPPGVLSALTSLLIYSLLASFTINPRSEVGMAVYAGIFTSFLLASVPRAKHILTRAAFLGSYAGAIVWTAKKLCAIMNGQNVVGTW
jgi:hypothetical protein